MTDVVLKKIKNTTKTMKGRVPKKFPDARSALYLNYYLDPQSPTFSNSLQSALKAGYSQQYAETLIANQPEWLTQKLAHFYDALSEENLKEKHIELLNQRKMEYFVFPKTMEDDEIQQKVESAGLTLTVIQPGEKGKYAFYSVIDANARKAALDMAYKIKGKYAPTAPTNVFNTLIVNDEQASLIARRQIEASDTPS